MDSYESTETFFLILERQAKKYFVFTGHYCNFEEKYLGVLIISSHYYS